MHKNYRLIFHRIFLLTFVCVSSRVFISIILFVTEFLFCFSSRVLLSLICSWFTIRGNGKFDFENP
jgi:hypothetical protein